MSPTQAGNEGTEVGSAITTLSGGDSFWEGLGSGLLCRAAEAALASLCELSRLGGDAVMLSFQAVRIGAGTECMDDLLLAKPHDPLRPRKTWGQGSDECPDLDIEGLSEAVVESTTELQTLLTHVLARLRFLDSVVYQSSTNSESKSIPMAPFESAGVGNVDQEGHVVMMLTAQRRRLTTGECYMTKLLFSDVANVTPGVMAKALASAADAGAAGPAKVAVATGVREGFTNSTQTFVKVLHQISVEHDAASEGGGGSASKKTADPTLMGAPPPSKKKKAVVGAPNAVEKALGASALTKLLRGGLGGSHHAVLATFNSYPLPDPPKTNAALSKVGV